MEYSMIEARSIEALVAVLNVQAGEGWELVGSPVVESREESRARGFYWIAIVARKIRRAADKR